MCESLIQEVILGCEGVGEKPKVTLMRRLHYRELGLSLDGDPLRCCECTQNCATKGGEDAGGLSTNSHPSLVEGPSWGVNTPHFQLGCRLNPSQWPEDTEGRHTGVPKGDQRHRWGTDGIRCGGEMVLANAIPGCGLCRNL